MTFSADPCTRHLHVCRPSQGVQVGEFWRDRLHCRQWGAHFPHVAGIAGQSGRGAQSVVLSGGCVVLVDCLDVPCPAPSQLVRPQLA